MKNYSLKKDIKAGKQLLGTWAQIASQETVEIIGYTGYDFAIVDMEHGCMGVETAEAMVRSADAADLPVIVRVLDNQPTMIMKALETGAAGVLIPGVVSKAADKGIPMLANIFYADAEGIKKEVESYQALGITTFLCNADKSALITGLQFFAQNVRANW